MTQGARNEQGWNIVRKPKWWRRDRKRLGTMQSSSTHLPSQEKFRNLLQGRCFNCLAFDHSIEACRDPTKCWYCKKTDHVSSTCSQCLRNLPQNQKRKTICHTQPPTKPALHKQRSPNLSLAGHTMEHRRSMGDAPGKSKIQPCQDELPWRGAREPGVVQSTTQGTQGFGQGWHLRWLTQLKK
jgi:hypothetical protein